MQYSRPKRVTCRHPAVSLMRSIAISTMMAVLTVNTVQAAEDIRWNGFLNVIGGVAKHDPWELGGGEGTFHDGNYSEDFSFDNQTSAGLQATQTLDDATRVTAQIVSKGGVDNYAAKMQWLYLSYDVTEKGTLRVGRMGAPLYYYSDFMNVGYAYHWIRPPSNVYPNDELYTGVSYIHQDHWGDMDWSIEVLGGGQQQFNTALLIDWQAKNMLGAVLTLTRDNLSGRLSHFREDYRFDTAWTTPSDLTDATFDALIDSPDTDANTDALLRAVRPTFSPLITERLDGIMNPDYQRGSYSEMAIRYDTGQWFAMYETTRFGVSSYYFDNPHSWLVTAGIREGRNTFHLSRTHYYNPVTAEAASDQANAARDPLTVPPGEFADYLAAGILGTLADVYGCDFSVWMLGWNIETSANSVLKFQVDYIDEKATSATDEAGVGYNTVFKTALSVTF